VRAELGDVVDDSSVDVELAVADQVQDAAPRSASSTARPESVWCRSRPERLEHHQLAHRATATWHAGSPSSTSCCAASRSAVQSGLVLMATSGSRGGRRGR
jgi:hypothetical protein